MMMTKNLHWEQSQGGSMGANSILKVGDKYVGHFYTDASRGVPANKILRGMVSRYNAHDALVAALEAIISEWDDGRDADDILTRHHDSARDALALARKGG